MSALEPGAALPTRTYAVTRADLVAYAGASGDLNPIHWSERVATSVGLPGVVAHGMYTMALAGRAATSWAPEGLQVVELTARFSRPVVVPDDDTGVEVEVAGLVHSVEDGRTRVDLTVSSGGRKVLGLARVVLAGA